MLQVSQVNVFLSRSWNQLTFEFSLTILIAFGSNRPKKKKTLIGKVGDWVKKEQDLLNCKYKVTFQLDGCVQPTSAVTYFIDFGYSYCQDNIQRLKCEFVVFYSFVYLLFFPN